MPGIFFFFIYFIIDALSFSIIKVLALLWYFLQGLNYVAGLLLIATKDEEQSFWLLTVLIRNILPSYYSSNMQGLITDIAVLGELVRSKSSKLDRLLKDLHLPWPILVTKWFICLYAEVLPVEVSFTTFYDIFVDVNQPRF